MSKPILQHQPNTNSDSDKPTLSAAIYLRAMRKVPEVMVYFWIIKLLTTAMGEVTSDYLAVCRRDADAALRSVMVDCMHEKNIQNGGL